MNGLPFTTLVLLEPLGLLHGSSGRILSPETLTGRAAEHFPPDSPALAGLLASQLQRGDLWDLHTAGPFWCHPNGELMLPAPMSLIQEEGAPIPAASNGKGKKHKSPRHHQSPTPRRHCRRRLTWQGDGDGQAAAGWRPADGLDLPRKQTSGGWISLDDWPDIANPSLREGGLPIYADPWQATPHLHPRLRNNERVSAHGEGDGAASGGALFLEYGIALEPGVRLVYLSSHPIADGRYRFGGEGHMVELCCQPLPETLVNLLNIPLNGPFALITPGVWGGPRLSRRDPIITRKDGTPPELPWHRNGIPSAILTERPRPWRHRLGWGNNFHHEAHRLSRGRWAVPAGTCYQVAGAPLSPWAEWPEHWFPKEGFSFKQLGTALALPLSPATA
jgi:CRISPR-associated protein Cmr3